MQLKHLQMQNFVGVEDAEFTFEKPVAASMLNSRKSTG